MVEDRTAASNANITVKVSSHLRPALASKISDRVACDITAPSAVCEGARIDLCPARWLAESPADYRSSGGEVEAPNSLRTLWWNSKGFVSRATLVIAEQLS
jgi:hypothetical protein